MLVGPSLEKFLAAPMAVIPLPVEVLVYCGWLRQCHSVDLILINGDAAEVHCMNAALHIL